MRPQYAKRQESDITALPTASGIDGSQTAGDPSATTLVLGTNTAADPSSTGGPNFVPGRFVSVLPWPPLSLF